MGDWKTAVTLQPVTAENWRKTLQLSLQPEQQRFVADVVPVAAIALAKAYIRPGGKVVEPYAISVAEQMVGFLNLHYTPNSSDDYWLFHFFIDKQFQRCGYGQAAMQVLLQQLRQQHPHCLRLRLTVHPQNQAGEQFYRQLGFSSDNELTFGEPTYSKFL
jgi:diamine N-acetyltransferase